MSTRELDRLEYLRRVAEGQLSQCKAAEILGLSTRQIRRLQKRLEAEGPRGLGSRRRGKPSNNRASESVRSEIVGLVRTRYADFGPTLAAEKLRELHGLKVSKETLRRWLTEESIWVPRAKRRRVHQPRRRRECFGELVQIDGSPHRWFEDRGPECTLLVYIDDATGRLTTLRFAHSETTFDYFQATRDHLRRHGKPVAYYSDKHSIFRHSGKVTSPETTGQTQFARALAELNVDIICANTPQAKGRVERVNRTLQDRLVKELRLRGISDIAAANAFAPEFVEDFNRRFGRAPLNPHNAHRPVREDEDLDLIFTVQEQRIISKDLVVSYDCKKYVIEADATTIRYARKTCTVHEAVDGTLDIRVAGRSLPFRTLPTDRRVSPAAIVENKFLGATLAQIRDEQEARAEAKVDSRRVRRRNKRIARANEQSPMRPAP